ncbi:SDR family oxidoreductase [Mycolicibacterium stellerae]|uniref:SDR family oxidoreductase n=1 Tax=Mycolicibacterium stellerae TaxID=2358193 RepID=UPI000F0B4EF7|nr:SDR family oxidoreductase [Mycolicibacterium stellerae]
MRIFVTGATGFIGSAVVAELIGAGHQVVGLARSDSSAQSVADAGAEVYRGSLDDPDSLRRAAENSDGVIHLAFHHDFDDFLSGAELDRTAIETLGGALAGSDRPLVVAGGILWLSPGNTLTEEQAAPPELPRFSEKAVLEFTDSGVRAAVVRLPPSVHGEGDHGFVPRLIEVAREKGVSAYPGDGTNRWPAVHRLDAAAAFRRAVESAPAGSILQATDDDGVPVREIAETIGRHLGLPVNSIAPDSAYDHFGWIGPLFSVDAPATSTRTRELLGWRPTHSGLLDDLDAGHYFKEG